MRYASEISLKEGLGIDTWRNLSKDTFLRFLEALPDVDREVALHIIGQVPEITACAKVVLEDAVKAYAGLMNSNGRSMEMVHQLDIEVLAILRNELDKDLAPEERMRVLDDIGEVLTKKHLKDSENKEFLAGQFDKVLGVALAVAASVLVVVLGGSKSGGSLGGWRRRTAG